MGNHGGAEIYELFGLYILSFLGKVYCIQNVGLREGCGLKITVRKKLKTVNFLDVTLNLCTGKYQPYNKPNDTPTYISVNSNYPPNIIKPLPISISQRISNISSDKATFNNAAPSHNNCEWVQRKSYLTRFDTFKESKTKKDNMV